MCKTLDRPHPVSWPVAPVGGTARLLLGVYRCGVTKVRRAKDPQGSLGRYGHHRFRDRPPGSRVTRHRLLGPVSGVDWGEDSDRRAAYPSHPPFPRPTTGGTPSGPELPVH